MEEKCNKYLHLFLWTRSLFLSSLTFLFFKFPFEHYFRSCSDLIVKSNTELFQIAFLLMQHFWVASSCLELDYLFLGAFSPPVPFCLCSPELTSYSLCSRGQDSWEYQTLTVLRGLYLWPGVWMLLIVNGSVYVYFLYIYKHFPF